MMSDEDNKVGTTYWRRWLATFLRDDTSNILAAQSAQEFRPWELNYMDSGVWKDLSNDLVEKVIALLPFPSLFKARAVCRHWNSFIFSTKFHDIRADSISWSDLSNQESYLLVFLSVRSSITCTAYSSVLNRWLSMPSITCLPSRAKDVVAVVSFSYPCDYKYRLRQKEAVTSLESSLQEGTHRRETTYEGDGGLLCFRDMDEDGRASLFVCNPVTQQCKELPTMLAMAQSQVGSAWIFTHLIVDRSTGTYALIVALYDHKMRAYAELYNSRTNSWTTESSMPLYKLGVFFNPQNGAFSNNILYCVATEKAAAQEACGEPLYVRYLVVYDFLGNWKIKRQFKTEKRQLHLSNAHVLECLDCIFMVVGVKNSHESPGMSITIYMLDPMLEARAEIGRLSDACLAEGWQPSYHLRIYSCIGQGDNICLLDLTSFLVLTYNVKKRSWRWLPSCPFIDLKTFNILRFRMYVAIGVGLCQVEASCLRFLTSRARTSSCDSASHSFAVTFAVQDNLSPKEELQMGTPSIGVEKSTKAGTYTT